MKIAIVTGASSGIGEAFLRELVKTDGAFGRSFDQIWIIARRMDKLEALRNELGDSVVPLKMDLTAPEDIVILEDKLRSEKPKVDLLINCAGMGKRGTVFDNSLDALEKTVELNCNCLTKITRICLPYMTEDNPDYKNGPRILNIASSAAFLPQPGFSVYAASKSYVTSFSRALRVEVRKFNIGVTTVCPGPVKTEFLKKATDNKEGDFTGIRALCAADPVKLAKASLKAARKGRGMLVYKVSQKALHVASKIVPTSLILWVEKVTMKQC